MKVELNKEIEFLIKAKLEINSKLETQETKKLLSKPH